MSTAPGPLTWTLRLKHHKTTILLHADGLQTLASLKKDLLSALRDRNPDNFHDLPIPKKSEDILLAKPVDPFDLEQGWDPLEDYTDGEVEDPFNIDEDAVMVNKPKAKKTLESENLKAYGVKDGAVLAFRFRGVKDREGWDVVQAVNIDEYGVENEGDMGVGKEYKG